VEGEVAAVNNNLSANEYDISLWEMKNGVSNPGRSPLADRGSGGVQAVQSESVC
jgi:hypothetical protein